MTQGETSSESSDASFSRKPSLTTSNFSCPLLTSCHPRLPLSKSQYDDVSCFKFSYSKQFHKHFCKDSHYKKKIFFFFNPEAWG